MFLNFVFSAACKHKRGWGGNKSLSKSHTKASKEQLMGSSSPETSQSWGTGCRTIPRDNAGSEMLLPEFVVSVGFVYFLWPAVFRNCSFRAVI